MEFSVAEMFGSDDVIAHADIPGLRLFAVQKNKSSAAVDDLIDTMYPAGWVKSTPATVCGAEYDNNGYVTTPPSPPTHFDFR